MEVARQLKESVPSYRRVRMNRKFLLVAASIVAIAAVVGGTLGGTRSLRLPGASTNNSYRVREDIERDYNEAIGAITSNYSGDIDYEKATQAAIQGMLSNLDPHS